VALKERSIAIAILIGVVVALVISALMYRASAAAGNQEKE
jgi:hypothetical protein